MNRPSVDEYFLAMAQVVRSRATCVRRSVGCVLVDARHHVLATGYNGRAAGLLHCNKSAILFHFGNDDEVIYPNACAGACAASGTDLDKCEAIHAEANALLQCPNVYAVDTCYVTIEPCVHCVKLLLNTSCARVVFIDPYPGAARELWVDAGRTWVMGVPAQVPTGPDG